MICDGCGKEVTRSKFSTEQNKWFCSYCYHPGPGTANVPGSMFPFTTMHIAGHPQPVQVQSLAHLRRLEAQHGVQSVAFNQDSNNWDPPRGKEQPR